MKRIIALISVFSLLVMFSACGNNGIVTDEGSSSASDSSEITGISTSNSDDSGFDYNGVSYDDMFSDRDMSTNYETDTYITLADAASEVSGENASVDNNIITINGSGVYEFKGTLSDGEIIVDADSEDKVQLVFNNVSVINDDHAAVYIKSADKVFITTPSGTDNKLKVTGDFVQTDSNNVDAAIFSKGTVTFNGEGVLDIECAAGHGVVSKDDLKVTGGEIDIDAAQKGLNINDSFRMAGGKLGIDAGEQGIKVNNDEDTTKGYVYIAGGELSIASDEDGINCSAFARITGGDINVSSGDDGIHSDTDLNISGGNVTVNESYEGLEAATVTISGGSIAVRADDDGINCAGGNDSSGFGGFGRGDMFASDSNAMLTVTGGEIAVYADGDGLDSNGYISVSGGNIFVSGPANGGNGSLDYGSGAEITGGTVIMAGASGMQTNFTGGTQGSFLTDISSVSAGTELTVTDQSGNVLVSFTPEHNYQSILFSSPELKVGDTYYVNAGGTSTEVVLSSTITGSGMGMGGGMRGGMGGMNPGLGGQDDGRMGGGMQPDGAMAPM